MPSTGVFQNEIQDLKDKLNELELDVWFNKTDEMLNQEATLEKQAQELMEAEFINFVQYDLGEQEKSLVLPITVVIIITVILLISVIIIVSKRRLKGNQVI